MKSKRNLALAIACFALALFLVPAAAIAQDCDESDKDC